MGSRLAQGAMILHQHAISPTSAHRLRMGKGSVITIASLECDSGQRTHIGEGAVIGLGAVLEVCVLLTRQYRFVEVNFSCGDKAAHAFLTRRAMSH